MKQFQIYFVALVAALVSSAIGQVDITNTMEPVAVEETVIDDFGASLNPSDPSTQDITPYGGAENPSSEDGNVISAVPASNEFEPRKVIAAMPFHAPNAYPNFAPPPPKHTHVIVQPIMKPMPYGPSPSISFYPGNHQSSLFIKQNPFSPQYPANGGSPNSRFPPPCDPRFSKCPFSQGGNQYPNFPFSNQGPQPWGLMPNNIQNQHPWGPMPNNNNNFNRPPIFNAPPSLPPRAPTAMYSSQNGVLKIGGPQGSSFTVSGDGIIRLILNLPSEMLKSSSFLSIHVRKQDGAIVYYSKYFVHPESVTAVCVVIPKTYRGTPYVLCIKSSTGQEQCSDSFQISGEQGATVIEESKSYDAINIQGLNNAYIYNTRLGGPAISMALNNGKLDMSILKYFPASDYWVVMYTNNNGLTRISSPFSGGVNNYKFKYTLMYFEMIYTPRDYSIRLLFWEAVNTVVIICIEDGTMYKLSVKDDQAFGDVALVSGKHYVIYVALPSSNCHQSAVFYYDSNGLSRKTQNNDVIYDLSFFGRRASAPANYRRIRSNVPAGPVPIAGPDSASSKTVGLKIVGSAFFAFATYFAAFVV